MFFLRPQIYACDLQLACNGPGVGLSVRKYVMVRRGLISSDALRSPGGTLSASAKAEIEYLLGRLARTDKRALQRGLTSSNHTI